MKFRLTLAIAALLTTGSVFGQLNMTLISNLDYDATLNDIWGYVDSSGIEYAFVGTTEGYSIVSLEDPADPRELHFIPGQSTTWRDIKTWGHFAYVVSDNTTEGMLIVDLSTMYNDTIDFAYWTGPVGPLGELRRSHNIYIDEFGLAYLAGSNFDGIVALDVHSDPWNPRFVLQTPAPYAHDVYVRDSIVYASEIYRGQFAGYDITDTNDIKLLGGAQTPFLFTHNAWLSDDSKTLFTTDERANAFVGSYDISDWGNIRELDRYRPAATTGEGVIPHNVHVLDDYLIISYYTDGVIVVDASKPDNLVEVGNYDTFLGGHGGFSGAWGAYPFLPSGRVLVSDRQSGLYVLEPNYVRGCYLEGVVRDASSDQPVFNAEISIDAAEIITPDMSDINGNFKMGKAVPGIFTVTARHPEYYDGTAEVTVQNGVVTNVVIEMEPRATYSVSGVVISQDLVGPAPGANVVVVNDDFIYETQANSNGIYSLADVIEGSYQVYAGYWGEYYLGELDVNSADTKDLVITPGYYDDYHFDYGWTTSGTATRGEWVRDIPISETYFGQPCNPAEDLPDDIGFSAAMTGNLGGDARDNSVEDGYTMLSSPMMDFRNMTAPVLQFSPWLCVRFTDVQPFTVWLSNGSDTTLIDTIATDGNFGFWRLTNEYQLTDSAIAFTDQMQVHFLAINEPGSDNLVKAAIDRVVVFDESVSSVSRVDELVEFDVYPNPASTYTRIEASAETSPKHVRVFNNLGQLIHNAPWPAGAISQEIRTDWAPGVYMVHVEFEGRTTGVEKLVVQR